MTGTIINAVAIILGSLIGILAKKGIPKRVENALNDALGVSILIIGMVGVIKSMITVNTDFSLSDGGSLILIASLVLGAFVGELLGIEVFIEKIGFRLEKQVGRGEIAKGFVPSTILFCVGAMAILGAISDGLTGDYSVLALKSTLDGISSIILSATLGIGVLFSAFIVFAYQGAISALAVFISPYITTELLNLLSMTGYAIIMCIGLNFLKIKKIKTANLLPALVFTVIIHFVIKLIH